MIDKDFIESLIQMLDESTLDNLEVERGGTRIRLSKSPDAPASMVAQPAVSVQPPAAAAVPSAAAATPESPAETAPAPAAASNLVEVPSPMVGTFYRAPAPDADPYVELGKQVGEGDVLCIIEAMKLMNELECETSGRIAEICVENGEPVEYGQVLFRIEPA